MDLISFEDQHVITAENLGRTPESKINLTYATLLTDDCRREVGSDHAVSAVIDFSKGFEATSHTIPLEKLPSD